MGYEEVFKTTVIKPRDNRASRERQNRPLIRAGCKRWGDFIPPPSHNKCLKNREIACHKTVNSCFSNLYPGKKKTYSYSFKQPLGTTREPLTCFTERGADNEKQRQN